MAVRVLFLFFIFSALNSFGQQNPLTQTDQSKPPTDELLTHLRAAETFQMSGDLSRSYTENRSIIGIALQRLGNVEIEQGKYPDAIRHLEDSLQFSDTAPNRTNLAIAYLRQNQTDKAIIQAKKAIEIDPAFPGSHYILGNIYFTSEDYSSALPVLERVMEISPDFDSAHALALTYLYLKRPENAKKIFQKIQTESKKDTADLHILFARDFERTNYPLEAERELKKALAIEPTKPKLSFYLGYLILQNGGTERMAEAGAAFADELKLKPNDFYSIFFAGVVESSENNHEAAIRYFQNAIEINPTSGEAHLFLAQSQIELNRLAEAETSLRRAIELESTDRKANTQSRRTHFLLGRLLLRTNRKEEGERELNIAGQLQQQALKSSRDEINQILGQVVSDQTRPVRDVNSKSTEVSLTPEVASSLEKTRKYLVDVLAQSYHNLGVIAVQKENSSQALENFSIASNWNSDYPGLDRNWGIVGFRSGQYDAAIRPLARYLKANPGDKLIRQMLGASYYFVKDFTNAVDVLKPLEKTLSSDPELAYSYGFSLVQLQKNQEAFYIFTLLSETASSASEGLFYAAQGFMILGDFERAAKEFGQIAALDPKALKANYFLGQCLMRLNKYDEAEQAFASELKLNPKDPIANYHLALTYIERKIELEKAALMLREAVELNPQYADARYQLGKIYLERGDTKKAIEQLEAAASYDDTKDYIHYQLSVAYKKAGRFDDAERALKKYKDLKAVNRKTNSPM